MRGPLSALRLVEDLDAGLEDDMPNEKRAAVTIIELRTRVEIYKLFFKCSMSVNTALLGAIVVKLLLG